MKSLTKASRVNTALQVIERMNEGMTVVDACQEVGMPRSSFYYFVQHNPEQVAALQEIVDYYQRQLLVESLEGQAEILRMVIEDAKSPKTKPLHRLKIYLALVELADRSKEKMQAESSTNESAVEALTGPKLRPGKSRLTATQTTVSYETEN